MSRICSFLWFWHMLAWNSMIAEARITFLTLLASSCWNLIFWIYRSKGLYDAALIALLLMPVQVYMLYKTRFLFQVMWRAYVLGLMFSAGANIVFLASHMYLSVGLYLCVLAFFHLSEYLATALLNPSSLTLSSFIINHSTEYNIAMLASLIEHAVLLYYFPALKSLFSATFLGLLLCVFGEVFRKLAMYTAGISFNHVVQYYKRSDHVLVTNGVYSLVRHPSYTGWFCWSVGTQVLLINPICASGYAIASWAFFRERIYNEEITLLNFFGRDYVQYKKRVVSGIPFVKGYTLKTS